MERIIKRLKIKEPIEVDNFKIGVYPNTITELVQYEDENISAIYTDASSGQTVEFDTFPTEYSKLIWQKGQQQQ